MADLRAGFWGAPLRKPTTVDFRAGFWGAPLRKPTTVDFRSRVKHPAAE